MTILTGITATASSQYSGGGYSPSNAFDGIVGGDSAWASSSATMPQWLQAQVSTGFIANRYVITDRDSSSDSIAYLQAPNTWTFLGSNDGTTWTTLDTQSGQVFGVGESKTFSFTNTTAYTYYRLNVTAINGSSVACSINELSIENVTLGTPVTFASETASEWYGSELPANAVDGNSTTNWTTNGSSLPQWWSAVLTTATAVSGYAIRARDDILGRNANTWQFQGRYTLTASASSTYSGTFSPSKACDGDWTTNWDSSGAVPQWLQAQYPDAHVVTSYSLGAHAGEEPSAPRDWTFQGSTDGVTWITLDTRSGVTFTALTLQTFSFSNATAYSYFRLNITALTGGDGLVRLARFDVLPPWPTLDSQSGVTWTVGQTRTFSFANATPYSEYRVYITANNGDSYTSIAEITMSSTPAVPAPKAPKKVTIVASRAVQRASRW